jgi:pterin-4a-carbinolamine dehydratase
LRARRFVPPEAFKQFKDTEDWRKENRLEQIFETIEIEEFEQTRRLVCDCAPTS